MEKVELKIELPLKTYEKLNNICFDVTKQTGRSQNESKVIAAIINVITGASNNFNFNSLPKEEIFTEDTISAIEDAFKSGIKKTIEKDGFSFNTLSESTRQQLFQSKFEVYNLLHGNFATSH